MRSIAARIQANLTLDIFLPLLAIALATTWYGLWPSLAHFVSLTGRRFVDMQPGLTPTDLLEQVNVYTPAIARYYLWWLLFDVAWPFLTYTTMLFITAWLLRGQSPAWQRRFTLFVVVAYATVLMDWSENLGFALLVLARPDGPWWLAELAVSCHRAKLLFNMLFNAGFLLLLAAAAVRFLRERGSVLRG